MNGRRGSAIVLSMLLLVLLSALGMFMVSVPVGTGESAARHHRAAVARNMARAGANAAIARLPAMSGGAPVRPPDPRGPERHGAIFGDVAKGRGGGARPLRRPGSRSSSSCPWAAWPTFPPGRFASRRGSGSSQAFPGRGRGS